MPSVAFLSTDNLEGFFVYDELLIPFFNDKGWEVSTVSWRNANVDWGKFDYVIVRSTWDYQQNAAAFLQCLARIERSTATLLNDLSLIKWNIEKYYLKDLAAAGVPVIDTVWSEAYDNSVIVKAFKQLGSDKLVIKPVLSANADDTFTLDADNWQEAETKLKKIFNQRPHMLQPFMQSIVDEGEFSLFYFAGAFSHAIKKVPQKGDFRVQEEHGGSLHIVDVPTALKLVAEKAMQVMPCEALYARVDLVRMQKHWGVMELELIEPSLYFNLDNDSPLRFVQAVMNYHDQRSFC
tara:strand:- start:81 stop:959 length:879 start_codon:yes stop_codon:yes gene_type:complete